MIYQSFSLYKNGHLAPLTQRPTANFLRPLSKWSFLSEYRSLWLMIKAIDISNITSLRIKKSSINENLVHFLKFFEIFFDKISKPCKDYNENKHKYKATAQTIETEHAKKAHQISSQRLYKKEGEGTCLTYF